MTDANGCRVILKTNNQPKQNRLIWVEKLRGGKVPESASALTPNQAVPLPATLGGGNATCTRQPRFDWLPASPCPALPWSPGQRFTDDRRAEGAPEGRSQTLCDLYSPELEQGSVLGLRPAFHIDRWSAAAAAAAAGNETGTPAQI